MPSSFRPRFGRIACVAGAVVAGAGRVAPAQPLFFDDFDGSMSPLWTGSPGAFPSFDQYRPRTSYPITYLGAPASFTFGTLDGSSVLRLRQGLPAQSRRGWVTAHALRATDVRCEVRLNTLTQSRQDGIDALAEIWLLDASLTAYVRLALHSGCWSTCPEIIATSPLGDGAAEYTSFASATWYRLVLSGGQNDDVRASLLSDGGVELWGYTFPFTLAALGPSVRVALTQAMDGPGAGLWPVSAAFDRVALTERSCYADCDTSTGPRVLDALDFLCFRDRYAVGAPYACDGDTSTGPGVCDIFDFLCFQNAFAAGCP